MVWCIMDDYRVLLGSLSEHKLMHCKAVADYMYKNAIGDINYKEQMYTLGLLHDIGYIKGKADGHAKAGGEILKLSNYKYWQEVYWHGNTDIVYSSKELDLLNEADLQIDYMGNFIGFDARLEDIKVRYGIDSNQYKNAFILVDLLRKNYDSRYI